VTRSEILTRMNELAEMMVALPRRDARRRPLVTEYETLSAALEATYR
jgi:hypothetical protein